MLQQPYQHQLSCGELECVAHDVLSYRHHRHTASYEVDIVLSGRLEFVRDGKKFPMEENDVIIVNPHQRHATLSLAPNTITLVLRFPAASFRDYLEPEKVCSFDFVSNAETRELPRYRYLRFYCALLLRAMSENHIYSGDTVQALFQMIRTTLFTMFEKNIVDRSRPKPDNSDETSQKIMQYIDENYAKKLSLEELAEKFQYNRTYLSTLFKKNTGISFYDYLTYVRFSHAVWDLSATEESLTKIALYNGFPDLKTFNRLFQDFFQLSPADYRRSAPPSLRGLPYGFRSYRDLSESEIKAKLDDYTQL